MARPRLGAGESERLHLFITPEEIASIEEWRSKNEARSKSEAVRRLCQIGIAYDAQADEWKRLVEEVFEHIGAIGREALELDDSEDVDYKNLHLRSLAHLVFISKSASELAQQISELSRFAKALQTESDIEALIQEQAELRSAMKSAAGGVLTHEDDKK